MAKARKEEFTLNKIAERIPKIIEKSIEEFGEIEAKHIDFLFMAFLEETKLKPSLCELVRQNTSNGMRWYFKKKK